MKFKSASWLSLTQGEAAPILKHFSKRQKKAFKVSDKQMFTVFIKKVGRITGVYEE